MITVEFNFNSLFLYNDLKKKFLNQITNISDTDKKQR